MPDIPAADGAPDASAELAALRARVVKLEKINQALLKQVEGAQGQDSAFSMFQTAILLDRKVRERTDDLEATLKRLQESHRALNAAKAEADAASNAKSEFLAVMSHEIRTPLNGVIGVANLLLDGSLDDDKARLVRTIRSSGEVLLRIITDILDFSKVEAGRLSLQAAPFSIDGLLEQVQAMFIDQAVAGGIALTLERAPEMHDRWHGDEERVRQILVNLVGNALKFTAQGSVSVQVCTEAGDGGTGERLRFTVTDTGVGIPPAIMARLFEPFHVADTSSSRRFGGTGLGLAIVQRLARLMGGDASVRSEVGTGTEVTFTVTMPRANAAEASAAAPAAQPFSCSADILVVEDNPVNQLVTARTLQRFGCRVQVANNGVEALAALDERRFDLVFMDCHMPELDGYQATRELRRRADGNADVKVVALTANAMRHDRQLCLDAGMNDYATKPIKPSHLRGLLEKWLAPSLVATGSSGPSPRA